MTTFVLAQDFLLAALLLVALACVGDLFATRQMATDRYFAIPLVKLLRRCAIPGMTFACAFALLTLDSPNSLLSFTAIWLAVFIGLVTQVQYVRGGYYGSVLKRGIIPALLVLLPLANLHGLEIASLGSLHLALPYLLAGLATAAGLRYIDHLRGIQDYLRRRD